MNEIYHLGDFDLDDKRLDVINQYELTVNTYYPERGAMIFDTDHGLKILRTHTGSLLHLEFEDALKKHMAAKAVLQTDLLCRTSEGKLYAEHESGDRFYLRNHYRGEDCDLTIEKHCIYAIENMARLHNAMEGFHPDENMLVYIQPDIHETLNKRTRELKRVRSYMYAKKQKNAFEVAYLRLCDSYYNKAVKACGMLAALPTDKMLQQCVTDGIICHGNYTYHNLQVLSESRGLDSPLVTTNFEKAVIGLPIFDVYHFLRKVLEKNGWNAQLGNSLLNHYTVWRPIDIDSMRLLYILFLFPEKFWKITNHYFNNRKSWIPQKHLHKLQTDYNSETLKQSFLSCLLRDNQL